mmetsp:Transcript_29917/g.46319  ORF Transcript_29917/g.46319 Transcript_29917/m.46319 type:complete len:215 (-) Transcript_29917:172-816(-)|eukprot:CAMPEP_0201514508 /NCGR_PEP_ID=MMETSP0161_2-20130828/6336_1 /ASSEMBLY_ACC=CAM_ASM_000251 /TAXON_ID=180227 /ORGANISM="Neoparamoeba aestuarina, Strain SoJaBio B1-5/56/2" /LENGTH=214 /DNA_ID=CAMNT_0047911087 /DNA_START=132 /DNA_END=776 /DNA_ORIENTATION=-
MGKGGSKGQHEIQKKEKLKIVCLGSPAVGKTSFLLTLTTKEFPAEYIPTTAHDFVIKHLTEDKDHVELSFHDTGGHEEYDRLRPLVYPDTDVFIIMMSITDRISQTDVGDRWVPEVIKYNPETPIIFLSTKNDLREDQEAMSNLEHKPLTREDGEAIADAFGGAGFVEISSMKGTNLDVLPEKICQLAFLKHPPLAKSGQMPTLGGGNVKKAQH